MKKESARERRIISLIERDYLRAIDTLLREPPRMKRYSHGMAVTP